MLTKETIKLWMHENKGTILYDPLHYGVFTGYVTFTPTRAKMALENNIRNRKIKKEQISVLSDVMSRNLWDDNVSKINFSLTGELSDGQNRLYGCVRSGCTFRCLVTWGLQREAQLVTDRRGSRSLADDLQIAGYKNATNLAATIRVSYMLQEGIPVAQIINTNRTSQASDQILYNYFANHQDENIEKEKLISRVYQSIRELNISRKIMAPLVLEFDRISSEDAEAFWKQLASGIARFENDPIIVLRKRLIEDTKSKTSKIPNVVKSAFIIKAWNAYMRGEQIKTLWFRTGGANPEQFPEIYNPYFTEMEALAK